MVINMVEKTKNIGTERFVLLIVYIFYLTLFDRKTEPFNQIQINEVIEQSLSIVLITLYPK